MITVRYSAMGLGLAPHTWEVLGLGYPPHHIKHRANHDGSVTRAGRRHGTLAGDPVPRRGTEGLEVPAGLLPARGTPEVLRVRFEHFSRDPVPGCIVDSSHFSRAVQTTQAVHREMPHNPPKDVHRELEDELLGRCSALNERSNTRCLCCVGRVPLFIGLRTGEGQLWLFLFDVFRRRCLFSHHVSAVWDTPR